MNGSYLHFAHRELTWAFTRRRLWMAFGIVVALFALTGPFGTHARMDLPARLGYWLLIQGMCWSIALAVIAMVAAGLRREIGQSLPVVMIGAGLAGVPTAITVEVVNHVLFDFPLSTLGTIAQILYSIPMSLVFGALAFLIAQNADPAANAASTGSDATIDPPNRLMNRLSPQKRGPIFYLTMRDHYVEVVTQAGNELLLMRLSDAMAELPDGLGCQIHRSHWAAKDAVSGSRREGGRILLKMPDGTELPVSRGFAAQARAEGLIS